MRLALAIALVACSAPSTSRPSSPTSPTPPASPNATTAPPPVARPLSPHAIITAPHGGQISQLALSPDASAALTSDELGGSRFWPSLDGTREPVVLDLPHAKALALARRGDGFTAFALDDVGGLVLVELSRDGVASSRATLPADPPVLAIAMTELGLLAWRSDQTIALYGPDGAQLGRIGTEPGEHVVALAAGPRRAAVIVDGEQHRVRWIELQPRLAWGAAFDLGGSARKLAVAPSGKRIATVDTIEIKGTTNPVTSFVVLDEHGASLFDQAGSDPGAFAFVDDQHLALASGTVVQWFDLDNPRTVLNVVQRRPLAVAAGQVVSADGSALDIVSPVDHEYIGYAFAAPQLAREGTNGELVVSTGAELFALDAKLALVPDAKLPRALESHISDLRWLGGSDWALLGIAPKGGLELVIVDTARDEVHVARSPLATSPWLAFEPRSRLFTLSFILDPEVDRFDPASHELVRVAADKAKGGQLTQLVPLDPALAGGDRLLRVRFESRTQLEWLADPAALDKPRATTAIDGGVAATDAAGHVYTWVVGAKPARLAVLSADGTRREIEIGELGTISADPRGTRFLVIGRHAVSLFSSDGTRLWVHGLDLVHEPVWLSDGGIAIIGATGIARVDPSTGELVAARCGWHFGRTTKLPPPVPAAEPVCTQLRR